MMSEPICLILDTLQLHSVLNTSGNSISQIYNINWRHLAIKSAIRQYGFSLTKSREASPFDCPRLPKATTTTDVQRGGAESPTGVSYSEHMKPIFKWKNDACAVELWTTVCKTFRPMISDRCLSVCLWRWCIVGYVCCGQTAGSINQSINIYFPSNNIKLQCNKCCSTWRATRKALRSFRLVAWTKKQHKY